MILNKLKIAKETKINIFLEIIIPVTSSKKILIP